MHRTCFVGRIQCFDRFPGAWRVLPAFEGLWFACHSARSAPLVQPSQRELCLNVGGVGIEPQDAAAAQGVAKILGGMNELGCPGDFDALVSERLVVLLPPLRRLLPTIEATFPPGVDGVVAGGRHVPFGAGQADGVKNCLGWSYSQVRSIRYSSAGF